MQTIIALTTSEGSTASSITSASCGSRSRRMSSSTTTGIVDALVDTVSAGLMRVSGSLSEAAVAVEVEGAVGNADVVAVADAAALGFVGVVLTGAGGGIM